MAEVITVRGPLAPQELGLTHSHEHLAARPPSGDDDDLRLDDRERMKGELARFAAAGGGAIVETTTVDYGRDVDALAALSSATGVHVVAVTGFNKGRWCRPHTEGRDPEAIARRQSAEIERGVGDSRVRCGAVKFGTSLDRIEPWEDVALRAAAITHACTGCPVVTHTEEGTMALEQLDRLAALGVAPDAVVLCHLDRRPDVDLHLRVADRGAFLSYDQLPKSRYRTAEAAQRLVASLAERGLHERIVVGGDLSRRSYFAGWGGPGLTWLNTVWRAGLEAELARHGLSPEPVVDAVFVTNPARAFARS